MYSGVEAAATRSRAELVCGVQWPRVHKCPSHGRVRTLTCSSPGWGLGEKA